VSRYPKDTVHGVVTKELELVQGKGYTGFTPTPGYTPEDMFMSTDIPLSPDARRLLSQDPPC